MIVKPSVSIIICTQNRADHLRQTLASLAQVCVPNDLSAELLVVDNASTDNTAEVIKTCRLPNMPVRYIHEHRRGLSHARNTGIAAATGDIILFTDDDVRFPYNWIVGMCQPILEGKAHAVVGGVELAPHLVKPWMTSLHASFLASTKRLDPNNSCELIGANMGLSRKVLSVVPYFDVKLGAGTPYTGEETLFSLQLLKAGFKFVSRLDDAVEHHFDASRLKRNNFFDFSMRAGRAHAYIAHHWRHERMPHAQLFLTKRLLRLAYWRMRRRREWQVSEGMPEWEMSILMDIYSLKQYIVECKHPRQYEKHGLVKLQQGIGAADGDKVFER